MTATETANANYTAGKPFAHIMTITPAIAKVWLHEANIDNRKLRHRHVAALANDVTNGNWHLSPDAIAFDTAGRLINGQHRLTAIVEADKPADAIVLFNASAHAWDVTDDGVKRTLGDRLARDGHTDAAGLAAVVAGVYAWEIAGWPANASGLMYPPTKSDYLTRFNRDPEQFVHAVKVGARTATAVGLPRGWWATAYFMFTNTVGPNGTDAFYEKLITGMHPYGLPLMPDDPCLTLRRTIERDYRNPRPTIRTNRKLALALIVKAFNAYVDGRPVKVLKYRAGGENPEAFPEIAAD